MLVVGLTGGIGSGKSTVADLLAAHGAVIVDADVLARDAVAAGTPGLAEVVRRFGGGVLASDGSLDRARLGRIVFADDTARADLEAIVHPRVRRAARRLTEEAAPDAIVVQVIPLLVETGQAADFDAVIVVDVDPATQLERVMRRSGLGRDEVVARIAAQATREERLAAADLVIDNSAGLEHLRREVDRVWAELRQTSDTGPVTSLTQAREGADHD